LIDIDGDNVTVLEADGSTKDDLKLPNLCESDEELSKKIKNAFDDGKEVTVTVIKAMDKEAIKGIKISTNED